MNRSVCVKIFVDVSVDESKFTDQFMQEFRESMYQFATINDHVEHLAQLHARGIDDDDSFIEGYGPAAEMGIKFRIIGIDAYTLEEADETDD